MSRVAVQRVRGIDELHSELVTSLMPRNLLLLTLGMLLAGCGQKAEDSCPVADQAGCVDSTLSYHTGIGDTLKQRCAPCHAPGGVEAALNLMDYAHVSEELMDIGFQLATCSMPPAGSPQPTAAERKQILAWLDCGGPE